MTTTTPKFTEVTGIAVSHIERLLDEATYLRSSDDIPHKMSWEALHQIGKDAGVKLHITMNTPNETERNPVPGDAGDLIFVQYGDDAVSTISEGWLFRGGHWQFLGAEVNTEKYQTHRGDCKKIRTNMVMMTGPYVPA